MEIDFATLTIGIVTTMLGISVVASPERSARVWGRKQLTTLTSANRTWYLRGFRVLGLLLCSAGLLVSLQSFRS
jgi:hypothetical protein